MNVPEVEIFPTAILADSGKTRGPRRMRNQNPRLNLSGKFLLKSMALTDGSRVMNDWREIPPPGGEEKRMGSLARIGHRRGYPVISHLRENCHHDRPLHPRSQFTAGAAPVAR